MILKEKTSNDLEILNELASRYPAKRKAIEEQIRKSKAGIEEEMEAARYLSRLWGRSENVAILHDLRFELPDGEIFQIDHLMINRILYFTIFETKSAKYGLKVDKEGNFFRKYLNSYTQIPSPINQAKIQSTLLSQLMESENVIPKRRLRTLTPISESFVLVSPTAELNVENEEAKNKLYRYDEVYHKLGEREVSNLKALRLITNIVSTETVIEVANTLIGLHKPHQTNWAGYFGIDPVQAAMSDTTKQLSPVEHAKPEEKISDCQCQNRSIHYGRSYYFKCDDCGKNTAIKLPKGQKIRKEAKNFYVVDEAGTNTLFHINK